MSVSQNQVQILGTLIRENNDGLLCINDLWKASGKLEKNRPSKWLKLKRTKELLKIAQSKQSETSVVKYQDGHALITFADKKLFYSYLDWLDCVKTIHGVKVIAKQQQNIYDEGFVYVIECLDWYKIGKANDTMSRLRSLQTASPFQLRLVCEIKSKCKSELEHTLHERYSKLRGLGEWFKLSDSDIHNLQELSKKS